LARRELFLLRERLHREQQRKQTHEEQHVLCGESIHRSAPSLPVRTGMLPRQPVVHGEQGRQQYNEE